MNKSFCILGNGGQTPSIYKLDKDNGNLNIKLLSGFPPGQSVYRLALSASGNLVAAATKAGNIKVFRLDENNVSLVAEFQYRTAQPPHVTGLAFMGEDVLLTAGTDAKIRVLNIKTKERLNLITMPGIAFGLSAINNELFCCISRKGNSDHLMVWHLSSGNNLFEGPPFKINAEYLLAPLTIDDVSGFIAHSDRSGTAYIYDINNDYQLKTFDSGHGDFYGLLFNKGMVITGGYKDNGQIKMWSLETTEIKAQTKPLLNPVMAFSKFDAENFIAITAQGQIILIDYNNLYIKNKTQLNNIRHAVSLPTNVLIRIKEGEQKQNLDAMISEIRELFEKGMKEQAYDRIVELEKQGYDIHALKILAVAERAQGLLLNEIEALMMLLKKNPQGQEHIEILERLAELFEKVHEPEMAVHTLQTLINASEKSEPYSSKIHALEKRCIPPEAEHLLMAGFPSTDMIKPEFRKAELLGRYFQAAIDWEPEKVTGNLNTDITIDVIKQSLSGKEQLYAENREVIKTVLKMGETIAGPVEMLRLLPKSNIPDFVELWIEIRKGIDETKMIMHRVYYPHADEYHEKWNLEVLELFENVISNPAVKEWFDKVEQGVRNAVITIESDDEEDDLFSINPSK